MPNLNVDTGYFDHRKTKRLVGLLGRGAEVLPLKLWCYCGIHHAEDGRLTGYATQEIESLAGWWGKSGEAIDALLKVGFLDKDGDAYCLHDWLAHEGHIAAFKVKGRAAAEARWEKARSIARGIAPDDSSIAPCIAQSVLSNAPSNAPPVVEHCPNLTKPTKPNQQTTTPPPAVVVPEKQKRQRPEAKIGDMPEAFKANIEFVAAWERFEKHRTEKRSSLTNTTRYMIFAEFQKIGIPAAIAQINHTILKGWIGLRSPDWKPTVTPARARLPEASGPVLSDYELKLAEKAMVSSDGEPPV